MSMQRGMLAMIFMCALAWPAQAAEKPAASSQQPGVATLVVRLGQVEIEREGQKVSVKKGMLLFEGDVVKTKEHARAALLLQDGSLVRLNENTNLALKINVKKRENRLKVMLGQLWARIKKQDDNLEIETPSAVAAIKGTEFEIMVNAQTARLLVWDGVVSFFNQAGRQEVAAAQESSAAAGQAPSEPKRADLAREDQWFNSVVDVPASRTLKTAIKDKDGKEVQLNIRYNKK